MKKQTCFDGMLFDQICALPNWTLEFSDVTLNWNWSVSNWRHAYAYLLSQEFWMRMKLWTGDDCTRYQVTWNEPLFLLSLKVGANLNKIRMFSLFYGLWQYMFSKMELHVLILGIDKAGKTVLHLSMPYFLTNYWTLLCCSELLYNKSFCRLCWRRWSQCTRT